MAVSDEPVGRLGRNNLEVLIEFHISHSQNTFEKRVGDLALIEKTDLYAKCFNQY